MTTVITAIAASARKISGSGAGHVIEAFGAYLR